MTGETNVTKVTAVNPPTGNIAIPTSGGGPAQGPTGQVANQNPSPSSFPVGNGGNGGSAHFIFANLNGTISAWDTGATAHIQVTTPGANYSGLAINQAQTQLYAANQAGTGSINVFNTSFAPVSLAAGAFATPTAVAALGLVPFNVQDINGNIYVEYAPSGLTAQRNAALGQGAVVVFNEDGSSPQILISAANWRHPGASRRPRPVLARLAATCWLAISAFSIVKSTLSTPRPERYSVRFRSTPELATLRVASGPSISGSAV